MTRPPEFTEIPEVSRYPVKQIGGKYKGRVGVAVGEYPGGMIRVRFNLGTMRKPHFIYRMLLPKTLERINQ